MDGRTDRQTNRQHKAFPQSWNSTARAERQTGSQKALPWEGGTGHVSAQNEGLRHKSSAAADPRCEGTPATSPPHLLLFGVCIFAPASHKLTWTETAKKGSQRVHFAGDQLIVDFSLVLRRTEETLGQNPGLVFPYKAKSHCPWTLNTESP